MRRATNLVLSLWLLLLPCLVHASGYNSGVSGGGVTGFANPTASVGLSAVNGSATTAMRSDAAPALDQGIAPTWTALHTFSTNPVISNTAPGLTLTDTTGAAKSLTIAVDANLAQLRESAGASGSLLVLDLANNRVGIGATSTSIAAKLFIEADDSSANIRVIRHQDTVAAPASMTVLRTRGTAASPTVLSSGDQIGRWQFNSIDTGGVERQAANILGLVDGAPGASGVPGALTLLTSTAAGSLVERVRIDSAGNLGTVTTWGTNAAKVWGCGDSTLPTTSPANTVQWGCSDIDGVAGKHGLTVIAEDLTKFRFGNNSAQFETQGNGQRLNIQSLTESHTLAAAASSTTTIQIPANALVVGVATRVTTAITGCSPDAFNVGVSGANLRYADSIATTANATNPGTLAGVLYYAAATGIRFTCDDETDSFTGGVVRTTIHYLTITPATSWLLPDWLQDVPSNTDKGSLCDIFSFCAA